MLVGLFTHLLAEGGVQRAGRHIAAVLNRCADEKGDRHRLLSLNDPAGEHKVCVGERRTLFRGFARSKGSFILEALRCARSAPRLTIAAHPNLAPVALAMKVLAPGMRVIVIAHGIEVCRKLPWVRRQSLLHADLLLAPSVFTAAQLVHRQGVSSRRIIQLPWGLDPCFVGAVPHPPSRYVKDLKDAPIILAVGRMASDERYKGFDFLIRVLPKLLPAFPALQLVMVGDGDDRHRLELLAERTNVSGNVRFVGTVEQDYLIDLYRQCDIFALPSFGEGFGFAHLEAMAMGIPIVAGNHGGGLDFIRDGFNGHLVNRDDLSELATVLHKLLSDPVFRSETGRRARETVFRRYSFTHFEAALSQLLDPNIAN